MNITKKQIASLVDDVILRYQSKHLAKYIDTEDKKFRHDVLLTHFLIMFFDAKDANMKDDFLDLMDFYAELSIPYCEVKYAMGRLFREFHGWAKNQKIEEKTYHDKILTDYRILLQEVSFDDADKDDTDVNDDFLMFDSEKIDEKIDDMHYEDKDKISSQDYFMKHQLSSDDLEDIIFIKDLFKKSLDEYLEYRPSFLDDFKSTLSKLNSSLQFTLSTKEFKDIGFALEKLYNIVINIEKTEIQEQELIHTLLTTFIEDLIKWLNSIFISQDAIDIHYLDASLFANISQFEILFQEDSATQQEDSDDDFLF